MAYIFQTKNKNGRFHPKYRFQYTDSTGKRRTGTGTASKSETKKIAQQVEAEHEAIRKGYRSPQPYQQAGKLLYNQIIQEYIAWGESQGGRNNGPWSPVHAKNRRNHLPWWGEKLQVTTLQDCNGILPKVEEQLRALTNIGKAGKTLANYAESLNGFLQYCVDREYLEKHPLAKMKPINKKPLTIRREFTHQEVLRLLACAPSEYELLYKVALTTGLRLNELRSLTIAELDLENSGLHLRAEWTKNRKAGFQLLPLELAQNLHAFATAKRAETLYHARIKSESSFRYPEKALLYVPNSTTKTLTKTLKKADILKSTEKGKLDFHSFRVTYINLVVNAGASVKSAQSLARHSNPDLTMNVYARDNDRQMRSITEQVGNIILAQSQSGHPSKGSISEGVNYTEERVSDNTPPEASLCSPEGLRPSIRQLAVFS